VRRLVVGRVSRLVHEKSPQTFLFFAAAVKRALAEAAARDHAEQMGRWRYSGAAARTTRPTVLA